jgi:hypothetical protein
LRDAACAPQRKPVPQAERFVRAHAETSSLSSHSQPDRAPVGRIGEHALGCTGCDDAGIAHQLVLTTPRCGCDTSRRRGWFSGTAESVCCVPTRCRSGQGLSIDCSRSRSLERPQPHPQGGDQSRPSQAATRGGLASAVCGQVLPARRSTTLFRAFSVQRSGCRRSGELHVTGRGLHKHLQRLL